MVTFDPTRPCGTKTRAPGRYTRAELDNIAIAYGIVDYKIMTMDELCATLRAGRNRRGQESNRRRQEEQRRQQLVATTNAGNVLPDDVMREIGARLSPKMLIRLAATNRRRRAALAEDVARVNLNTKENRKQWIHALATKVYGIKDAIGRQRIFIKMEASGGWYFSFVVKKQRDGPYGPDTSWTMTIHKGVDKPVLCRLYGFGLPRIDEDTDAVLALSRRALDDPMVIGNYIACNVDGFEVRDLRMSSIIAYILVLGVTRGLTLRVSQQHATDRLRKIFRDVKGADDIIHDPSVHP
jgi:hypothetical protein